MVHENLLKPKCVTHRPLSIIKSSSCISKNTYIGLMSIRNANNFTGDDDDGEDDWNYDVDRARMFMQVYILLSMVFVQTFKEFSTAHQMRCDCTSEQQ